ncbi:hypothetical protein V8E53_002373 [Lactarius tabidus]
MLGTPNGLEQGSLFPPLSEWKHTFSLCGLVNQGHSDFSSFSDIRNPGSYTAPYGSLLLQGKEQSDTATFNFNEFWKFGEGETMEEPFDLCNEVVEGLLHALGILRDTLMMVTHIEGQVKLVDEMLDNGHQNLCRQFNLQEKEYLGHLILQMLKKYFHTMWQKQPWDNPDSAS